MTKSKSQPALSIRKVPVLSSTPTKGDEAVDGWLSSDDDTPEDISTDRKRPLKYFAWAFVFGMVFFWRHEDLVLFLIDLYIIFGHFMIFLYKATVMVIVCLFTIMFEELKHSD
ncbi:hypothetical protein FRC07_004715 [Ceratobasidium sp. 392]|nr:hypothetical protein FRC07_004715 [Ceratobasidium sp. 392]